ncbi:MAG TPA: hypothetical protein VNL71_03030 [Chloroflexota bacterium]|nr:hypothetical protein [Chloroflexota bacterium]
MRADLLSAHTRQEALGATPGPGAARMHVGLLYLGLRVSQIAEVGQCSTHRSSIAHIKAG